MGALREAFRRWLLEAYHNLQPVHELGPACKTPKLAGPAPGEGMNNSDVDLFEWEGNTYVYYATGDQATWGSVRVAMYVGPMRQFFESCFPPGTTGARVSAKR